MIPKVELCLLKRLKHIFLREYYLSQINAAGGSNKNTALNKSDFVATV